MNSQYFLEGSRVGLRALDSSDITGEYESWLNDIEVTKFTDVGVFPESRKALLEYHQSVGSSKSDLFLGIFWKNLNQHIGNVKLGPINWVHRHAAFSILIGDKKFWGRGLCEEVTRLVCDHAFVYLNLNRVHLGVVEKNLAAVRAYEKVGFTVEGKSRDYFWVEGRFHDNINMALLKSEYFSIHQNQ